MKARSRTRPNSRRMGSSRGVRQAAASSGVGVPRGWLETQIADFAPDKTAPVVVTCVDGVASIFAGAAKRSVTCVSTAWARAQALGCSSTLASSCRRASRTAAPARSPDVAPAFRTIEFHGVAMAPAEPADTPCTQSRKNDSPLICVFQNAVYPESSPAGDG